MEALRSVAEECVLPYDFVYHSARWEVDSPVVVASTGRGALVRTDVTVQLSAEARGALGAPSLPPAPHLPLALLAAARAYLAHARARAYRMGADAARWVERPELLPHPVEHYDAKISSRMTVCRLRGEGALHRRLDIKVYPRELLPFALLYFTGSDYYNRSLRAFVNKVGWQLSDKGLCRVLSEERVIQGGKRARVVTSRTHSVKCANEEDVLRAIGAPWKAPHERDA